MSYKFLDNLERRFGRYAVPYVTETIIAVQVITYLFMRTSSENMFAILERLVLTGDAVVAGEPWRLLTFLAIPPKTNLLFAFFAWYLFWLYGRALDHEWGTLKYNIYLLIAYVATVAVAFAFPAHPVENYYIGLTVFFAFAVLYPDFELLLFFVLPVKVKWLAWIAWAGLVFLFLRGDGAERWLIQASVLNFMLFFGKDIAQRFKGMRKAAERNRERHQQKQVAFHTCAVCGKTDKTAPDEEFRYCPECEGSPGFCSEHIFNHEHITAATATASEQGSDEKKDPPKPKREKW